ncbi:Major Facilitator Superfamily (MFS) [Phytophthora cinnamomi]|uniref:Major Facilitator Superfamily (MFS) n=1 Tax=Phytophthora cinnamomi TaxID=4785 RepID=UPI003559EB85|nr:Major Facilitator Superfamily (MFS) [Phytophthora cinnamomi]
MGRLALTLLLLLLLLLLLTVWTAASGDGDGGGGGTAADVQPGAKLPVARTYRTAYGTHFARASTWPLLLGVHVLVVVGGLLLLSVIPVRFASTEKREAPFVLWFGAPKRDVKVVGRVERHDEKQQQGKVEEQRGEPVGSVQTESLWQRVSAWLEHTLAGLFVASPAPARDNDARYRFHADMTQQLAAASAKTYESIAVSTEDIEPSQWHGLSKGTGHSPQHLPRPPSRASIFAGAPASPPSGARLRRQGSTTFSEASFGKAEALARRASRESSGPGGVTTKEDFIRAAYRRQSMEARVEKREALAQEDVSYENLGDEEIRTYEYLEFLRELLDGLSVKKLCQKSGRVVSRTLYITPDILVVFWNPTGTFKQMRTKSSIHTETIQEVLTGIHGSPSVTAKSTPERDALCVSIRCSDGKWLVLQSKTEAMRQRLFLGFSRLAQEKQEQDAAAAAGPEPTIPEVEEEEEEADEYIEKKERQVQSKAAPSK